MPRSREIVPAEALIEIAKDPHRYAKLLKEFGERQKVAVVAEAKARDAVKDAEAAQKTGKEAAESLAKREGAVATRESDVAAANRQVEDRLAAVKDGEVDLAKRLVALSESEDALDARRDAAVQAVRELLSN